MGDLERKVIVVDGVNYSGKTSVVKGLSKEIPGAFLWKFSDYYHATLQRQLGFVDPFLTGLSQEVSQRAVSYHLKRCESLISYVKNTSRDDFLIDRLHPTDYVYQRIVLGVNPEWQYSPLEDDLNSMEALLVILTIDDATLKLRMPEIIKKKKRGNCASFEAPGHLLDYGNNLRKRDLYLEFFERSLVKKKLLVDTSKRVVDSTVEEICREI